MPKVVLKNKKDTLDVTNMISTIKWSGSTSQIARMLELDFLYPIHDYYAPKIYPNIGDKMYLYDDTGEELFRGRVFYNERFGEQGTIQITCYEDAIRLSKSKGTYNFKGKTAETITRTVCNDLGIEVGELATTGIQQKLICSNMNMYEIIRKAYESVGSQNGKKYQIGMKRGKLNVEEVAKEETIHILRAGANILECSYSENAEGVVNKVKIYDEQDQYIGEVKDDNLIILLGAFQEAYTKEEDKQARTMAQSILQGIESTIEVGVSGHTSYLSGKAIKMEDSLIKLQDSLFIEEDEHEWSNKQYKVAIKIKLVKYNF